MMPNVNCPFALLKLYNLKLCLGIGRDFGSNFDMCMNFKYLISLFTILDSLLSDLPVLQSILCLYKKGLFTNV